MYELLRGSGVKLRGTNEAMMTRTAMHLLKMLAVLGAALLMWGLLFAYASSSAQAATLTVNSLADCAPANDGTLTVSGSTISGNRAIRGGGINNNSTLTTTGSTISENSAGVGGGVYSANDLGSNTFRNTTTITNSTISGNTASNRGGGVYNFAGLSVIVHSTITGNTAPGGQGSGVASFGAPDTRTEVLSTIISGNTNTDVDFTDAPTNSFLSKGYNLIGNGNATGAFNQTGDQTGVTDPGLGALSNNGGPTQTHALLSGSPAINAIPQGTNGCGTTITEDQRGVSRPQGSACDIGSFELEESDTEAPRVISTFPRGGGKSDPGRTSEPPSPRICDLLASSTPSSSTGRAQPTR